MVPGLHVCLRCNMNRADTRADWRLALGVIAVASASGMTNALCRDRTLRRGEFGAAVSEQRRSVRSRQSRRIFRAHSSGLTVMALSAARLSGQCRFFSSCEKQVMTNFAIHMYYTVGIHPQGVLVWLSMWMSHLP
ncbi:MAG: hypothetical protein ACYCYO_05560 [Bacilli bacterium]